MLAPILISTVWEWDRFGGFENGEKLDAIKLDKMAEATL
jgi:hypothetical protein